MKIKHNDLVIDENNPFKNCQLDREQYANILTSIVQNYEDGFVMALNGEWGTGKTTFVKMWERQLKNNDYKTMYFNAWENDFEMEPMIAILGELKKLIGNRNKKSFKSLLEKGVIITKNIFPALAEAVANKYFDAEIAKKIIENSIDAATEILEKEVDNYVNKKQGLADFKVELEKFIKGNNNGKPVVFIIDELDRCRPDYAVEVLEKIKHFFSVEGIVFVLSIDKIQLGNSIQGYYGSDKINTNEYLRRFIDIEYQLPNPEKDTFCNYLYKYYQFEDFFNLPDRNHEDLRGNGQDFISFTSILFVKHKYTLRQQEKLFAHSRIVLNTFSKKSYVFPELLFLLIHIRDFETQFYNDIKSKKLTIQELVTKIESLFKIHLDNNIRNEYLLFTSAESLFILFYYNYFFKDIYDNDYHLIKIVDGEKKELNFKTENTDKDVNKRLLEVIIFYQNKYPFNGIDISFLLKKIDLIENIK